MNVKYENLRLWKNYAIIIVVSIIALLFLPMIGSTANLKLMLPNSRTGWVVYIVSKLCIVAINFVIFHSFMQQAKLNVRDNPKFIEANEIMGKIVSNKYNPRSPEKWLKQQYGTKGTTLFITTLLGCVTLTQAVLAFDWTTLLTYLCVIVSGVIFGIFQMSTAEDFWTGEYWQYAKLIQKKLGMVTQRSTEQTNDRVLPVRGVDLLESLNQPSYTCIDS